MHGEPELAGGVLASQLDVVQRQAIHALLQRIMASPPFRSSRRSQTFLAFIVDKTLDGHSGALKERSIGVEAFGRAFDYETADDAIVRISANDVRKRLAQYEVIAGTTDEWRITLPAGSYVPEFHRLGELPASLPATPEAAGAEHPQPPAPSTGPAAAPDSSRFHWLRSGRARRAPVWVACAALGVAVAASVLWSFWPRSPLKEFWLPVLNSTSPAIITIGQSTVYLLSEKVHGQYDSALSPETELGPHVAQFGSNLVPGSEIIPVTDLYTGVNDAIALSRLAEMFAHFGKPVNIRLGSETSFSDLRDTPAILLGFNNRWNRDIASELRFTFARRNEKKVMLDHTPPGHYWTVEVDPGGHSRVDYALVSRVFNSSTGQLVVQAGGLGTFGTRAAGEFLTSVASWNGFLHSVPRDWARRNLQVVLQVNVIGNTPGPPRVVAVHCW